MSYHQLSAYPHILCHNQPSKAAEALFPLVEVRHAQRVIEMILEQTLHLANEDPRQQSREWERGLSEITEWLSPQHLTALTEVYPLYHLEQPAASATDIVYYFQTLPHEGQLHLVQQAYTMLLIDIVPLSRSWVEELFRPLPACDQWDMVSCLMDYYLERHQGRHSYN